MKKFKPPYKLGYEPTGKLFTDNEVRDLIVVGNGFNVPFINDGYKLDYPNFYDYSKESQDTIEFVLSIFSDLKDNWDKIFKSENDEVLLIVLDYAKSLDDSSKDKPDVEFICFIIETILMNYDLNDVVDIKETKSDLKGIRIDEYIKRLFGYLPNLDNKLIELLKSSIKLRLECLRGIMEQYNKVIKNLLNDENDFENIFTKEIENFKEHFNNLENTNVYSTNYDSFHILLKDKKLFEKVLSIGSDIFYKNYHNLTKELELKPKQKFNKKINYVKYENWESKLLSYYNIHGSFLNATTATEDGFYLASISIGCPIYSKMFKYPNHIEMQKINELLLNFKGHNPEIPNLFYGLDTISFYGLNILNEYWLLWYLKDISSITKVKFYLQRSDFHNVENNKIKDIWFKILKLIPSKNIEFWVYEKSEFIKIKINEEK